MNQQFEGDEVRLDAEAVKRVIDRAAALQQAHLETVSAEQLEALASEVGISPEFVRRALSEGEVAPPETRLVTVRRKIIRKKAPLAGLSARDVRTALTPGFLYALYALVATAAIGSRDGVGELFVLLLQPALLTLYYAQKQPHRRMGALVGLGLGSLPLFAGAIASDQGVPWGVGLLYGPVLAALGFGACAARKWWDERKSEEVVEEVLVEPAR